MNFRDLWSVEVFGNHLGGRWRTLLTVTWRVYEEPSYPDWRAFIYIIRWLGPGRRAFDFGRCSLIVELWWMR